MTSRILTDTERCLLRVLDQADGPMSRHALRHRLVLEPRELARVLGRLRRKLDGSGVVLLSAGRGLEEQLALHVTSRPAFNALAGWAPRPIVRRPRSRSVSLPTVAGISYRFEGRLTPRASA